MTSAALSPCSADDSDRSPARVTPHRTPSLIAEPAVTIFRPIIAMGDISRAHAVIADSSTSSPFAFRRDAAGALRWHLTLEDWQLTSPVLPPDGDKRVASYESVIDVYVGLLAQFSTAGFPIDNAVRCERSTFIKELGWAQRTSRGTPSGLHYEQLEAALDYLRHANIASNAVWRQLETIYGVRILNGNVSVLQSWVKSAPLEHRRVGRAVTVEATFSKEFADLLRTTPGVVRYCAAKYTELPRGLPRAMYRYIEGLRAGATEPTVTLTGSGLLAHLGSKRRDLEPSRMHAILDEPHNVLLAHRVIGDLPKWSTSPTGQAEITYLLECSPDLAPLLEETAYAYGVTGSSAQLWATGQSELLARVLAAAAQGIITPTRGIGRMVRNYVETKRHIDAAALPHFGAGRGVLQPKQRNVEFEFLQQQYTETIEWLEERASVGDALRRQFTTVARPGWVVDGLVLLAARRIRRAETLDTWKTRMCRWP